MDTDNEEMMSMSFGRLSRINALAHAGMATIGAIQDQYSIRCCMQHGIRPSPTIFL